MAKKSGNFIGRWAFLIGFVLAIIFGLGFAGGLGDTGLYILVIMGIIVGLFNIADEEVSPFLLSGAVLIIASALGGSVLGSIQWLSGVLNALLAIFVPATIIVAIKNVFSLARH